MTTETTPTTDGITYDPSWGAVAEASAEAEREDKTELVMRAVSVPLTDSEQAVKAVTLAALTQEIATAKTHLKETAAHLRDEIKALEVRQATVAEEIASGRGNVDVECRRVPMWEQNLWRVVRVDTGEVVAEEPMGFADRQMSIDDAIDDEDDGSDDDAGLRDDDEEGAAAELETRLDAALAAGDVEDAAITDPGALLDAMAIMDPPANKPRSRKRSG